MRRTPYTETGIRRVTCRVPGCKTRATFQWRLDACASGNRPEWFPLCVDHDIALNRHTLEFLGHPDVDRLMAEYEADVRALVEPVHQ